MAAHLIEEARKGAASGWAPYIASLPGAHLLTRQTCGAGEWPAGTMLLSEAQVGAVQYAPAVAALRAFQQQSKAAYDSWRSSTSSATAATCPWERFALALHLVQSRSIRLAITGCRVMIPGTWVCEFGIKLSSLT